jgi:glycosyltransferase involved in cell wall biosynthesis
MPTQPLVSVIVPIYNMAAYLRETVDSILASDYSNLEIILMDDGSTDDSFTIAREYADRDPRIHAYTQANAGACHARNEAITRAFGVYILPVDGDDRISRHFIRQGVEVLEKREAVKVVCAKAVFFGERSGEWKLPPFSLPLLARKNMMPITALYRRSDWERVGGYCEEIIAREDWEFWIALLKEGGEVVRLPETGLYYRVRSGSKRVSDRKLKHHVIDTLNFRHPEFFEEWLDGPLRYQRTWSKRLNHIHRFFHPRRIHVNPRYEQSFGKFVRTLPAFFNIKGTTIYQGRNRLKVFEEKGVQLVVKSYQLPNFINRIVYNSFRPSKARRSYRYAELLRRIGVDTPEPIGFYSTGTWLFFGRSYFVSRHSECTHSYRDFETTTFPHQEAILRAIARTTARLHDNGLLHKDYSAGNILFEETEQGIRVEVIDLNRMRFGKVSMERGCKNFERLPGTHEMFQILADEYAKVRGFDPARCLELIELAHASRK